jgi:hypothetical protein
MIALSRYKRAFMAFAAVMFLVPSVAGVVRLFTG